MAESVTRLSPRQKMINLMYIVLTAMLALNVSSDVLDGFVQVEDGLSRTNATIGQSNDAIYSQLEAITMVNPAKGTPWLSRATEVRQQADALFGRIDSLKMAIIRQSTGEDGTLAEMRRGDDVESAAVVMLANGHGEGSKLKAQIDGYRDFITTIVSDSAKLQSITQSLSTEPIKKRGVMTGQSWENSRFEGQPVVAAVTMLTKLQNDVRYSEGEALSALLEGVDAQDVRVNRLSAFVIPRSQTVMRGSTYSANIVLAAIDTTATPDIVVGGSALPSSRQGLYEFTASRTGKFDYSGFIEVTHGDGSKSQHPFTSSYTVVEPSATVSATMMNVLYAGIANPVSISVPGVPNSSVNATMTNGTLTRNGDLWTARPSKVGEKAVITVMANIDGRNLPVATHEFRVRRLPDPTAFVVVGGENGSRVRHKGNGAIARNALLASPGIEAAIDDDMLNIDFQVLGFETVIFDQMGNAMPEVSRGAAFSERQLNQLKRLGRGKRFFISRIRAKGPDGIERVISPVEVVVK